MRRNIIRKSTPTGGVTPDLVDYERARATFSWEAARREPGGLPGGPGLNIAHEAVDRHAEGALANTTAVRCIRANGLKRDHTFSQLRSPTDRFTTTGGKARPALL